MSNRLLQIIHSYVPAGVCIWLCLWFIPFYDQTERIVLFAVFVQVPLTLFTVMEHSIYKPDMVLKILVYLIPAGSLALAGSFLLAPGIVSGLLSIPWSLVTFVIAAFGITLLLRRTGHLAEASKAVGYLYVSIGGIWLIAHQFGLSLLGFQGHIMLLTVNHFHYAGFVAPILFGFLLDSQSNRALSKFIVILGGIAPILIALGMTYSPILEWLAVVIFTLSLILYSVLVFAYVIPGTTRFTKGFHLISSGAIWMTMALALTYGFGEWSGHPTVPISTMIIFHGWGNAVLFSFIGVLAWHAALMDKATKRIPFSHIQGKGKIGAGIFRNLAVLDQAASKKPSGLIDDMNAYRGNRFNPEQLHPDIIEFYEHTEHYKLLLAPHWHQPFPVLAKGYKYISQWLEQLNFPLGAETYDLQVKSSILPILDDKDGRNNVRAWVRTYTQSAKAIYAALYSSHVSERIRYMNIAFPLPYSQMTSILYFQHGPNESLVLSSWPSDHGTGDQGVYLVINQIAIHLPINETITVWKEPGSTKGRIEAKHDMWLFGFKFLSLDYHIFKDSYGDH